MSSLKAKRFAIGCINIAVQQLTFRKAMIQMRNARLSLITLCAVVLTSVVATADTAGALPAYRDTLADLRHARAYLNVETPDARLHADDAEAIEQIDAAIRDVEEAAVDEGKSLNDHPPVDEHAARADRLRRALELLDRAHEENYQRAQVSFLQGLKANSAQQHIHEARKAVQHALAEGRE